MGILLHKFVVWNEILCAVLDDEREDKTIEIAERMPNGRLGERHFVRTDEISIFEFEGSCLKCSKIFQPDEGRYYIGSGLYWCEGCAGKKSPGCAV